MLFSPLRLDYFVRGALSALQCMRLADAYTAALTIRPIFKMWCLFLPWPFSSWMTSELLSTGMDNENLLGKIALVHLVVAVTQEHFQ